jgi:hypothetical protein
MKGTKPKRRRRLTYLDSRDVKFVQRKLTLAPDLDKFLTDFARGEGFRSEVEAVYYMIREFKNRDAAPASAVS